MKAAALTPYEDAAAFVDRLLDDEVILAVARALGNRREGQIALALAITTAAGNAVAHLVSHERAGELHRQRASYHRARACKAMPIARRVR